MLRYSINGVAVRYFDIMGRVQGGKILHRMTLRVQDYEDAWIIKDPYPDPD